MSNADPDLQRNAEATRRLGELVAGLRRLQDQERVAFAERFARFAAPDHRRAFRRLFATKKKA